MTRPLPLAIFAIVFMWLAVNLSTFWMWIFVAVTFFALVGLIIAMRFMGMYVGPKTLADDFRRFSRRVADDEGGEADRIALLREMEAEEEDRQRILEEEEEDLRKRRAAREAEQDQSSPRSSGQGSDRDGI